jgi:hypothetical protein
VSHLASLHNVHLVAFFDDPEDEQRSRPLMEICRKVDLLPLRKSSAVLRGLISLGQGRTLKDSFYYKSGGGKAIDSDEQSEYQELLDKIYLPL